MAQREIGPAEQRQHRTGHRDSIGNGRANWRRPRVTELEQHACDAGKQRAAPPADERRCIGSRNRPQCQQKLWRADPDDGEGAANSGRALCEVAKADGGSSHNMSVLLNRRGVASGLCQTPGKVINVADRQRSLRACTHGNDLSNCICWQERPGGRRSQAHVCTRTRKPATCVRDRGYSVTMRLWQALACHVFFIQPGHLPEGVSP